MMRRRGAGEGTVYQRSDGRWTAQVTIGYNADGRQKRATFYGRTRKEVVAKIRTALHQQQTGTFVEPHKTTLGQWLDNWMVSYQKPKVSISTYELRLTLIRVHIKPVLGNKKLTKLKPSDLQNLYTEKLGTGRADGRAWEGQVTIGGRGVSQKKVIVYGKTEKEIQGKIKQVTKNQKDVVVLGPNKRGLSSQTVRHIHNILHGALKQAMREGLVNRNVAQATEPPKIVRGEEMRTLSRDEVSRFLGAIQEDRLYAAFLLDLATGLRRGELLALRWADLDLDKRTLQVRKSLARVKRDGVGQLEMGDVKTPKSRRLIPLPEEVTRELRAHKARQNQEKLKAGPGYQDQGLVFATALGTPTEPRAFTRRYETLIKGAGVEYTRFHNLRHTFATMLLEMGEHPKVVQEMLGHSQVSMTLDTYSHIIPGLKERAASKLNDIFKEARDKKGAN